MFGNMYSNTKGRIKTDLEAIKNYKTRNSHWTYDG